MRMAASPISKQSSESFGSDIADREAEEETSEVTSDSGATRSERSQSDVDAHADAGYVVLCLRKCTKGPPLLPSSSDPDGWVQAERDGFNLTSYLRAFLAHVGASEEVYDAYNGQLLVPYQAALRRDAWERGWAAIGTQFKEQRAAYRWMFGGNCGPEISESKEPRFSTPRAEGAAAGKLSSKPLRVHVRRTGVQRDGRPRCCPYSTLESNPANALEPMYVAWTR